MEEELLYYEDYFKDEDEIKHDGPKQHKCIGKMKKKNNPRRIKRQKEATKGTWLDKIISEKLGELRKEVKRRQTWETPRTRRYTDLSPLDSVRKSAFVDVQTARVTGRGRLLDKRRYLVEHPVADNPSLQPQTTLDVVILDGFARLTCNQDEFPKIVSGQLKRKGRAIQSERYDGLHHSKQAKLYHVSEDTDTTNFLDIPILF